MCAVYCESSAVCSAIKVEILYLDLSASLIFVSSRQTKKKEKSTSWLEKKGIHQPWKVISVQQNMLGLHTFILFSGVKIVTRVECESVLWMNTAKRKSLMETPEQEDSIPSDLNISLTKIMTKNVGTFFSTEKNYILAMTTKTMTKYIYNLVNK